MRSIERRGACAVNAPLRSHLEVSPAGPVQRDTSGVTRLVPALLAAALIIAVYWSTASSIIAIWIRSETFAHGFLVVPLCLWLAWGRRARLAVTPVKPWWPGLALIAAAGALWLVTAVGDVLVVRQFALVFLLQATIVTIVGLRMARELALPLAFLLFAVPAGEILVPTLIDWTADFTVMALRGSGVPVLREGNHFIIPSGAWSVVEACSGVRYLIASFMVGVIYAAVAYRSAKRRALFIAAAILLPIVANWLRAYAIVMIGHLSDNRLAVGVDHLVYGWVFFGVVMLLLFWVGSFWQESPATQPQSASSSLLASGPAPAQPRRMIVAASFAAVATALFWGPVAASLEPRHDARSVELPLLGGSEGWRPVAGTLAHWKPRYQGYAAEATQVFAKGNTKVGLYIAYYVDQRKGRELVTSGNLLNSREDWNWKQVARRADRLAWLGDDLPVERHELASKAMRLDVLPFFWVDGHVTANEYAAKALVAWAKLTGRGDDAALITAYTPIVASPAESRAALHEFVAAMAPDLRRALTSTRRSLQ
jgi:exosortase A